MRSAFFARQAGSSSRMGTVSTRGRHDNRPLRSPDSRARVIRRVRGARLKVSGRTPTAAEGTRWRRRAVADKKKGHPTRAAPRAPTNEPVSGQPSLKTQALVGGDRGYISANEGRKPVARQTNIPSRERAGKGGRYDFRLAQDKNKRRCRVTRSTKFSRAQDPTSPDDSGGELPSRKARTNEAPTGGTLGPIPAEPYRSSQSGPPVLSPIWKECGYSTVYRFSDTTGCRRRSP